MLRRKTLITVGLLMMSILTMILSVRGGQGDTCEGSILPTRLPIGTQGRVTLTGSANNVRDMPDPGAAKIGKIQPGSTFTVVDGHYCTENATWLEVDNGEGLVGWTVEIIDNVYALEPIPAPGDPTGTPPPVPTLALDTSLSSIPEPAVFGPGTVDYQGVHFEISGDIATQIEAAVVENEPMQGAVIGTSVKFVLKRESEWVGDIRVLSAQEFNNYNPTEIDQLRNTLATGANENSKDQIPLSMSWFAGGTLALRTNLQSTVMPFGSGSMFRRLGVYSQSALTLHTIYEAHGLSSDGLYYVIIDVNTAFNNLEAYPIPPEEFNNPYFNTEIETYYSGVRDVLAASPTEAFAPNINQFDAMLSSLTIAPGTLGEIIEQANTIATANAPALQAIMTQNVVMTETLSAQQTAFAVSQATQAAPLTMTADALCGGVSRLQVGEYARQGLGGNNTLRMREEPGGKVITGADLYPRDEVYVNDGPVCVDDINWWNVISSKSGVTGWVAEAGNGTTYMELVPTASPPIESSCVYIPTEFQQAYNDPDSGTYGQYYLVPQTVYYATKQYVDTNGYPWYYFAYDSVLTDLPYSGGNEYRTGFWWPNAYGAVCPDLPRLYSR